jgi:hypothetical protein
MLAYEHHQLSLLRISMSTRRALRHGDLFGHQLQTGDLRAVGIAKENHPHGLLLPNADFGAP